MMYIKPVGVVRLFEKMILQASVRAGRSLVNTDGGEVKWMEISLEITNDNVGLVTTLKEKM
jgi:hypothetical protein